MILQLLLNGLIAGSIYALIASGFSLIYSVSRIIHFAHGAVLMFSAYFLYLFFRIIGINFEISVLIAILLAVGIGYLMNLIYKQFRKRNASPVIVLIASFALLTLSEALILLFFGADAKFIGFFKVTKGINVLGAMITPLQILIVLTSIILFLFLMIFMKKTKTGKAMRAVADNKDVAEVMGISAERIYAYTFVIGSLMGAIGGLLIGLEQSVEPTIGANLMIKGFTAAVMGGISSPAGGVLGSYLLGLVENFSIWFLPAGYKDAIAFIILFLFLLFKPDGIIGVKRRKEQR